MKLTAVFEHWEKIHNGTIDTLGKFTDEELSFRPYEGSWSAGEIALHIANAEVGWFRYALEGELDEWPPSSKLSDYPTVDEIQLMLSSVHRRTQTYLANLPIDAMKRRFTAPWGDEFTLGWLLWHIIEHEVHHRGELSLILGIMGKEGLDV